MHKKTNKHAQEKKKNRKTLQARAARQQQKYTDSISDQCRKKHQVSGINEYVLN